VQKPYTPGIKKSQNYIESPGLGIFNHSRWNHFLFFDGSSDSGRLDRIIEILWGVHDRNQIDKNELRDAMHISTAVKYGGAFFVTTDKGLLKQHERIKCEFGLNIVAPDACLAEVSRRLITL
jgi:hypothetical protein